MERVKFEAIAVEDMEDLDFVYARCGYQYCGNGGGTQ